MTTHTVRLHRVLRCPPERIYKAFTDPGAFERWLPPFGFTGKVHSMEPVVGGSWRMSFTTFGTGHSHSFGGKYLELVPGQRIAYNASFDDPGLPGTMTTTVTLTAVSCGTTRTASGRAPRVTPPTPADPMFTVSISASLAWQPPSGKSQKPFAASAASLAGSRPLPSVA